jgi:hypothetical protein
MTAYVARNPDGSIAKGWILKSGTSINSSMCRPPSPERSRELIEEVPVDVVLSSAASGSAVESGRRKT